MQKLFVSTLLLITFLGCSSPAPTGRRFTEVFTSPDTGAHQGYATDGRVHYLFDTQKISVRADDPAWTLLRANSTPFAGLTGFNHLGDGDYFESRLYVPAERYVSCDDHDNSAIAIFDVSSLERISLVPLPDGPEVSSIAVDTSSRELWISSYCDGARLWVYDLDSFELKRTVPLSPAVNGIQGIALRSGEVFLAQNDGRLQQLSPSGSLRQVYETNGPGAHEGLDYSQQELRWLIDKAEADKRVHYLIPVKR